LFTWFPNATASSAVSRTSSTTVTPPVITATSGPKSWPATTAFTHNGELKFETGRRLAATVLAGGGSQPACDLYRAFRGHNPDPAPLLSLYGIT